MPVRFYGGPLNALSEGFAAGSQGLAAGLRHKELLKQRQDEEAAQNARYQEQLALAKERAALDRAQSDRADQTFAINKAERDKLAQSTQDIATQAVTSGLKEGAMGPHSQEDEFALDVARRMSPEMLPRFMDELHREKRTKMLVDQRERHLSDLQSFASEPGAQEFMTEDVQARLKGAFDDLTATEDPEQLSKLLPLTRATIDGTRELLAERSARKQEVESVGAYYQQQLATDMQNAMMERNPAIKAWKLQQLDQQRRYLGAFMTSKPGSVKTADFMAKMSAMDNDFPTSMLNGNGTGGMNDAQRLAREQAFRDFYLKVWTQQHPPKKDNLGHVIEPGAPVDLNWLEARVDRRMNGDQLANAPTDEEFIRAEMRGAPQSPAGGAQPQPKGGETPGPASPVVTVRKFTEAPKEAQVSIEQAIRQAIQEQRPEAIQAIFEQAGVDPESIPEDVLKRWLEKPKKPTAPDRGVRDLRK